VDLHPPTQDFDAQRDSLASMHPANLPASPSFAGLLAELASPAPATEPDPDDGLRDDIAVLSYESALRINERPGNLSGADRLKGREAGGIDPVAGVSAAIAGPGSAAAATETARESRSGPIAEAGFQPHELSTRTDRVTLRLSHFEALQLRARAAESGLSVSAYLRTCILEVESLRAQVKNALARMRTPEARDEPSAAQSPSRFGPQAVRRWRERFFPHRRRSERAECA
jgi:hypothetical protein